MSVMDGYLFPLANGFCLFIIAIIIHEYGHYVELRKHHKEAKIYYENKKIVVGEIWMYKSLTEQEKNVIYARGVVYGLFPLVLIGLFIDTVVMIFYLLIYIVGSWHDIRKIYAFLREDDDDGE